MTSSSNIFSGQPPESARKTISLIPKVLSTKEQKSAECYWFQEIHLYCQLNFQILHVSIASFFLPYDNKAFIVLKVIWELKIKMSKRNWRKLRTAGKKPHSNRKTERVSEFSRWERQINNRAISLFACLNRVSQCYFAYYRPEPLPRFSHGSELKKLSFHSLFNGGKSLKYWPGSSGWQKRNELSTSSPRLIIKREIRKRRPPTRTLGKEKRNHSWFDRPSDGIYRMQLPVSNVTLAPSHQPFNPSILLICQGASEKFTVTANQILAPLWPSIRHAWSSSRGSIVI